MALTKANNLMNIIEPINFAVAYTVKDVNCVSKNCTKPIMVLNQKPQSFDSLWLLSILEQKIYSFEKYVLFMKTEIETT